MRLWTIALMTWFLASQAEAIPYPVNNPKAMVQKQQTATGEHYSLDIRYLDKMVADIAVHAGNYPVQFDSAADRTRAVADLILLSGMLEIVVNGPTPDGGLLLRYARLNRFGHNLDIPGATDKAEGSFKRLLAGQPDNPDANYEYGLFLASSGQAALAISYLEKAISLGVSEASYALGMSYLALGDRQKAIVQLQEYQRYHPKDGNVDKLLAALGQR